MRMMSDQAKLANARERIFWCVLHLFISSHLSHVLRTIAQSEKLSLDYFLPHPSLRVSELRPLMNLDSISGFLTNHVSRSRPIDPSKRLRDEAAGLTSILCFQFKEALEPSHLQDIASHLFIFPFLFCVHPPLPECPPFAMLCVWVNIGCDFHGVCGRCLYYNNLTFVNYVFRSFVGQSHVSPRSIPLTSTPPRRPASS